MASPLDASEPAAASPWLGASTAHYENFPVGSWLLPSRLRPAVAALYQFARYADDVADEGNAPAAERIGELARLRAAVLGQQQHPRVAPLLPWVQRLQLDTRLLIDLLSAFEQDVTVVRYADRAAVLDYCRRSADPVGRLMLQLFGVRHADCDRWSDAICSALQLINFLQDVAIDWAKGRVYLPQQALAQAGLDDRAIADAVQRRRADPALRRVIEHEADYAARLLESGRPLVGRVPLRLGLELRVILAGGARILDRLRAGGFDSIAARPVIGLIDAPVMLLKAMR